MVQSQSVELFDTTVVAVMTTDEARECVTRINSHMNSARSELLRLYEGRGWQALGYASWRECVTAEFERSYQYLYQQLEAARIEGRISAIAEKGVIPEGQLRPLAALTPMEQPIAWQEANERANGKPTARVVEEVVREMRGDGPTVAEIAADIDDVLDPPMEPAQSTDVLRAERAPRINAGMYTSATPEWYTPSHIVDRVEKMFEQISLDPCSNSSDWREAAIPAESYWTKEDDGLTQLWHGKVYMNPPYGDEIAAWVERLKEAYESGEIDEAIALLPARTDTAWFQNYLADYCFCFVRGRLKFSQSENSAPFPSVVVYLGDDIAGFVKHFHDLGFIK